MAASDLAQRHHWQTTLVGLVDAAWHLTDEEKFHTSRVIGHLLDVLSIPDRGPAAELPIEVALECEAGLFTRALAGPEESGVVRPVRRADPRAEAVEIAAWRDAFLGMLLRAYPDLDGLERLAAVRAVDDLLAALGASERAIYWVPELVARAHRPSL